MIDICTVVFREELAILKAQAQSVALRCQDLGSLNIYVVVNDTDDVVAKLAVFVIPWTDVVAELWLEIAAAVSVSVANDVAADKTFATSLALVNYLLPRNYNFLPV